MRVISERMHQIFDRFTQEDAPSQAAEIDHHLVKPIDPRLSRKARVKRAGHSVPTLLGWNTRGSGHGIHPNLSWGNGRGGSAVRSAYQGSGEFTSQASPSASPKVRYQLPMLETKDRSNCCSHLQAINGSGVRARRKPVRLSCRMNGG